VPACGGGWVSKVLGVTCAGARFCEGRQGGDDGGVQRVTGRATLKNATARIRTFTRWVQSGTSQLPRELVVGAKAHATSIDQAAARFAELTPHREHDSADRQLYVARAGNQTLQIVLIAPCILCANAIRYGEILAPMLHN
jgi:hypothetical protein